MSDILHTDYFIFLTAILLLAGVMATKFSARVGVPTLVVFIAVGMIFGSEGMGLIDFSSAGFAQLLGILALIVILFEGGLQTKLSHVKQVATSSLTLATLGVLLTTIVVGVAAKYILQVGWLEGLLFGAIVGSTDAAAVFAVISGKNIKQRLQSTLEAESGTNDPMAVFLTLSFIELIGLDKPYFWFMVPAFIWQMGVALVIGYLLGRFAVWAMSRINLDSSGLYPIFGLGFAVLGYSVTALIQASGLLAVYTLAIVMGNATIPYRHSILRFNEGFAWMMQILMFIVLGLLVMPSQLVTNVVLQGVLLSIVLMFVARPLGVYTSLLLSKYKFKDKLFISWAGLRGAVPIVLATYPMIAGLDYSQMFFNVVFFVVLTSALIQGSTIGALADKLKLTEEERTVPTHSLELISIGQTNTEMVEFFIDEQAKVVGQTLQDIPLPKDVLISAVIRDNQLITPNGDTILQGNDILFILIPKRKIEEVKTILTRQCQGI
ncbi:potassium/proton antiporter [Caldalkalibacillus salinus]|uniref:potassium/proton antiporter n=1 Tax=Caldalkalibacillus salinus TaxID=2803787 RepID=UPI001923C048|nr:potassium/proton antiporter [Caldalkalibacillus salinus]